MPGAHASGIYLFQLTGSPRLARFQARRARFSWAAVSCSARSRSRPNVKAFSPARFARPPDLAGRRGRVPATQGYGRSHLHRHRFLAAPPGSEATTGRWR